MLGISSANGGFSGWASSMELVIIHLRIFVPLLCAGLKINVFYLLFCMSINLVSSLNEEFESGGV
jgi:hypothetical protein